MKLSEVRENIIIALDAMKANKVRSFLASLGVVIGISTVIMMGWILAGLQAALDDTFKMIGVDVMYIDKWDWAGSKNWKEVRQRKNITYNQMQNFMDRMDNVESVFPQAMQWMSTIKYKNNTFNNISIVGTNHKYGEIPSGETILGRFFTLNEDNLNSNVVVIGHKVYETLFEFKDPIGKSILINGHKYTIIGVLKKQGTMMMDFIDNRAYLPISSYLGMYGRFSQSFSIGIKVGNTNELDNTREEARGLMRIIRNLQPNVDDDFSINETKAFEEQTKELKLYVWSIGIGMTILSFFVGIIGIMNIMFVSVTERTKEIGIRKAIGAKKSSILFQFIFEAAVLSLVGAMISLIFCSIIVFLVATILPKFIPQLSFLTPWLPFELLIIASLVSIFVGMAAGFIPALRASNLDPIEALRFE